MTTTPVQVTTPLTDTTARVLAALVWRAGGVLSVEQEELLDAPDTLTVASDSNGRLTFRADPGAWHRMDAVLRYPDGAVIRIHDWTITSLHGKLALDGWVEPSGAWPQIGDKVDVARLDLPGRGLVLDVFAAIGVYDDDGKIHLTVTVAMEDEVKR